MFVDLEVRSTTVPKERRSPWKIAMWGVLFVFIAFSLVQDLLSGDPTWWLVVVRLLILPALAMNMYLEIRKPKSEPATE